MKKLFFLLSMLCMALSPVFAAKSAIVGTWYILNPGREKDYYKFTEDNKCSKWIEYSNSETGALTTEQVFTDVPYSFDEENLIITVQEKEDFSWHWELESIGMDRFVVKGDWISCYRVTTFSQENQDGVTIYYSWTSDSECEVIAGKPLYEGEIVIPQIVEFEGVERRVSGIGNKAFMYCDKVTKVVLPEGLTSIGDCAFWYCNELKSIYVGATPPDCSRCYDSPFYGVQSECTLYVPSGDSADYQQADWWKTFENIVEYNPSSIKTIALKHCESIYDFNGSKMVLDMNEKNMYIRNGKKYLIKK